VDLRMKKGNGNGNTGGDLGCCFFSTVGCR